MQAFGMSADSALPFCTFGSATIEVAVNLQHMVPIPGHFDAKVCQGTITPYRAFSAEDPRPPEARHPPSVQEGPSELLHSLRRWPQCFTIWPREETPLNGVPRYWMH